MVQVGACGARGSIGEVYFALTGRRKHICVATGMRRVVCVERLCGVADRDSMATLLPMYVISKTR